MKHKYPYKWTLKDANFTKDKGKVFSCFACGGGSSFGYKLAGFDVIGCNEIDPKMMEAYKANHNPKYAYLEPIQTFKMREDLPQELYELDILDGSPPCFEEGTLVMTENGLQEIETLKLSQKVLTHLNRFMPIKETFVKQTNAYYDVKIQGLLPIKVTGEHPFYVRRMNRRNKFNVRNFSEPAWKDVKDLSIIKNTSNCVLEQDYIGLAINKESKLPIWDGVNKTHIIYGKSASVKNENTLDFSKHSFWYLIGRYIGDGWLRVKENKRHEFIICSDKKEFSELSQALDKSQFNYTVSESKTTFKFTVNSKELCQFVSQFGKGAKGKFLTNAVLDLPIDLLESFLDGYLDADGHLDSKTKKWSCTSISKKLIIGIQACVHKVYKCPTSISIKNNPKYSSTIEGRKVTTNIAYSIQFFKESKKQQHGFFEDGYLWIPFRAKSAVNSDLTVYNIAVEDDESYTFNNAICHNCSSFSMAGNREKDWGKDKVFREGQAMQVLDTLFFDFIDLAKKLQPKVVVAENVKGLLLGEAKAYVRQIYREFDKAGYYCQHWLLDASKMGVPQRRERVFFIALRKNLAEPFMEQMDMFTVLPKLKLEFNEPEIPFNELADYEGEPISEYAKKAWDARIFGDGSIADSKARVPDMKVSDFNSKYIYDKDVCVTLTSKSKWNLLFEKPIRLSVSEIVKIGTFPSDYNFTTDPYYLVGMSVPPVVMAQIASQIYEQWLSKIKK